MKKLEGYMAGVNLGGWLSQYLEGNLQRDPEHHFDRFITKEDIDPHRGLRLRPRPRALRLSPD